jgi:hypothetical protein
MNNEQLTINNHLISSVLKIVTIRRLP